MRTWFYAGGGTEEELCLEKVLHLCRLFALVFMTSDEALNEIVFEEIQLQS